MRAWVLSLGFVALACGGRELGGGTEGGSPDVGSGGSEGSAGTAGSGGTHGGDGGSGDGGLVCYQVTGSGPNEVCHYESIGADSSCGSGYGVGSCPSAPNLDGCCVVADEDAGIHGGCFYDLSPLQAKATSVACTGVWQTTPP
jgi:hypothetical protein